MRSSCLFPALALALTCLGSPSTAQAERQTTTHNVAGRVVIANRGDGTISVVDAVSDLVVDTHTLPGAIQAEPMYVVFAPRSRRVFVGDRANSQVVAYDLPAFTVAGTVPTGEGVFHMEMDTAERQMWVVNDIDFTLTVFNPRNLNVLATVPVDPALIAQGAKPHDVVVDHRGRSAFVTMFGVPSQDLILRYSTSSFAEVDRAETVESPHFITKGGLPALVVTGSSLVDIVNLASLETVASIPAVGAHGTALGRTSPIFYTANIGGGGIDGIHTIDILGAQVIDSIDTPLPSPHNLAVSLDGKKLYCTHSTGTGTDLSIYDIDATTSKPTLRTTVTVGVNPYGLAAIR